MSSPSERTPLIVRVEEAREESPKPDFFSRRFGDSRASLVRAVCGYCLVITAGLIFTAANVVQKIISPEINFWELLFYRGLLQVVTMVLLVVKHFKVSIWGERGHRIRMFFMGILGGLLLLLIFVAVKIVPLGNASAIFFCTPVCTFILAMCMLNENMRAYRSLISVVMMTGVVLITRPSVFFEEDPQPSVLNCTSHLNKTRVAIHGYTFGSEVAPQNCTSSHGTQTEDIIGYVCAILVPCLSAVVSIMTRQLKHIHVSVLMAWFGVGTFMVGIGGVASFNLFQNLLVKTPKEWWSIVVIVVFGLAGNGAYTIAMRWVTPSKANVFRSFEVILNYALQVLLEHKLFHFESVPGIFLLIVAVVLIAFESEVMKFGSKYKFL